MGKILCTIHNVNNYSVASHLINDSTSSIYFIFSASNVDLNNVLVITKQHLGYYCECISGIKTKLRILYEIFISGIIITITKILTILQSLALKYLLSFKRHSINHKATMGKDNFLSKNDVSQKSQNLNVHI